jgi:septal ring factor EnvC (AmiA/AmiB activator)
MTTPIEPDASLTAIGQIRANEGQIREDVAILQENQRATRENFAELQSAVASLQGGQQKIREDVAVLQEGQRAMREVIVDIRGDLRDVRATSRWMVGLNVIVLVAVVGALATLLAVGV